MANDLSVTRIGMAEHAYPTPTRNVLSEQQRRRVRPQPKGSEIRYGIRSPEGQTVMGYTDSELASIRAQELANKLFDQQQRKADMQRQLAKRMAEIDGWSHKA